MCTPELMNKTGSAGTRVPKSQIIVGTATLTPLAAHTQSPDSGSVCGEIWQLRGIRPISLGKEALNVC